MLYCAWDMAYDRCKYYFSFSFFIFCPFTPPTAQKMKISKKMKKTPGDIIILHKCTKNHDHMLYCSWDMAHDGYNCCFSFWDIFCPNSPKIQNFKKMKKMPGDIIISHMCTKNYDWMMYSSWDMVCDGPTYVWTEKVTQRWVSQLKKVTHKGGCPT